MNTAIEHHSWRTLTKSLTGLYAFSQQCLDEKEMVNTVKACLDKKRKKVLFISWVGVHSEGNVKRAMIR
jgi:hypothetical protein